MTKLNFILSLNEKLAGLPHDEIEEHLNFYVEMIEDRIEDGMPEEEAVAAVGTVDEIAEEIIAHIPLFKIAKEKIKPKRKLKTLETVLLAVGSPIWLPLAIAAAAVVLSLYISLWSIIVSLWSVFASFIGCTVGGVVLSVILLVNGRLVGVGIIGASLVLAGLAILSFIGCKAVTKWTVLLTKKIALTIKKRFIKREEK